ncbi:hypothetical protein, partial [Parasutterella excrementihominis]|uniref:hypothetical protein n=1 Tax=Parasutterella excrementihominis TaxID=487175 RepID=UPI003A8EF426
MKSTTTCAGIAENPMKIPFPSLPKYQARWIPVLFTPVTCGEDVLFVGICGEFSNTKFAERILPDETLKRLFPASPQAQEFIDFVIDALNKSGDFSADGLILSGFKLGRPFDTYCDTKLDLIEQAIKFSSSFVTFEEYLSWKGVSNEQRNLHPLSNISEAQQCGSSSERDIRTRVLRRS